MAVTVWLAAVYPVPGTESVKERGVELERYPCRIGQGLGILL